MWLFKLLRNIFFAWGIFYTVWALIYFILEIKNESFIFEELFNFSIQNETEVKLTYALITLLLGTVFLFINKIFISNENIKSK